MNRIVSASGSVMSAGEGGISFPEEKRLMITDGVLPSLSLKGVLERTESEDGELGYFASNIASITVEILEDPENDRTPFVDLSFLDKQKQSCDTISLILAKILKDITFLATKKRLSRKLLSKRGQEKYLPRFIVQYLKKGYGEPFCIEMIKPILTRLRGVEPQKKEVTLQKVAVFLAAFFPENHTQEDLAKALVLEACFMEGGLAGVFRFSDRLCVGAYSSLFEYLANVVIPAWDPEVFITFLLRLSAKETSVNSNENLLRQCPKFIQNTKSKRALEIWCFAGGDEKKFREGFAREYKERRKEDLEKLREKGGKGFGEEQRKELRKLDIELKEERKGKLEEKIAQFDKEIKETEETEKRHNVKLFGERIRKLREECIKELEETEGALEKLKKEDASSFLQRVFNSLFS